MKTIIFIITVCSGSCIEYERVISDAPALACVYHSQQIAEEWRRENPDVVGDITKVRCKKDVVDNGR